MPRTRRLDRELSWPCPPAFARIQRRIARGAIEGDACLDPIENEGVALGPGDANVGLGIDFKIDCAAVAKFAVDDRELGDRCAVDLEIYRSEEHTSELQSLMRNSYAVFCLKKKKNSYYDGTKTKTTLRKTTRKKKYMTEIKQR